MKNTAVKFKIYSVLKVQKHNNPICPAGAKGLTLELRLHPDITVRAMAILYRFIT